MKSSSQLLENKYFNTKFEKYMIGQVTKEKIWLDNMYENVQPHK